MNFKPSPSKSFFSSITISLLAIFFSLIVKVSYAQNGVIEGTISDKENGFVLPGVTVTVEGTDIIVFTDENGKYKIDIEPGKYKLRAELLGYNPTEAVNVVVVEDKTTKVDMKMVEAEAIKGEEMVVTGERLTVPLSKTTASVAVVGSQEIEKLTSTTNATDLIINTPGVQVESGGSEFSKIIKIRGRTIAPPSNASAGILLLIDGVPANDPAQGYANMYQIPAENIERIEVLKGASSAQYGGQAAAGVINIITRKGQKKPFTKVSVQYGTYQPRRHAETELTESYSFVHSWGNKYFDYSISGGYSHSSGMTTAEKNRVGSAFRLFAEKNPGKGRLPDGTKVLPDRKEIPFKLGKSLNELMDVSDIDKGERYSVALNLGINLFKNNTLRIAPQYSLVEFYTPFTPGNLPIQGPDDTFLQFTLKIFNRKDFLTITDKWEITPNLTYNFRMGLTKSTGGAIFVAITDFQDFNKEQEALGKKDGYVGLDPSTPFQELPVYTIDRSFSFANDLTYKFDVFDGDTLTVGQEYRWVKSFSPFNNYNTPSVKRNVHSLFFQNLLSVKKFTLSVGARWDQSTLYIEDFDDELSPRFGINYEFRPGTTLRFSVGRARRFLDFARQFGLGQNNGRLWGNPFIGPEVNWTYELGFRFSTKYVSGDIAYFYDDMSDLEIPVPLSALGYSNPEEYAEKVLANSPEQLAAKGINTGNVRAGTFINGPDAVFQGFDISMDFMPMRNWTINTSYTFTRAVVGNNNPFDFGQGQPQDDWEVAGKTLGPKFQDEMRIAYMPTHIFKFSSSFTFPFGLNMVINGRYKSTTDFFSGNYAGGIWRQPEHWVFDYKMSQPFMNGKLKFTFAIENVFSKLYYESGGIPSTVAKYLFGIEAKF
ncbi:MAG: TonB-dependent receptor [Candidatus Schekmanbacteria bacterium]|nr:MAG: TonB-dependent receptor [Candidatus Schekmanbacteria bacterium]